MASQYEALEATQASTCGHVCSVMVVGSNPLSSTNKCKILLEIEAFLVLS